MPLTIKVAGAGITVAKLLWRHGGRRGNTSARLTETLELNPGLAALGAVLPLGTKVTLPDLPPVPMPAKAPIDSSVTDGGVASDHAAPASVARSEADPGTTPAS